jgi:glycosyltransferase involved in cell wall biosynthesis
LSVIIKVIIPAYNEQDSISRVINDIPSFVSEIIVVNNASTDKTAETALNAGATVLSENRKGYGYACLKGIEYISNQEIKTDIVVFLDGDYSDFPDEMDQIIDPIISKKADFVVGARVRKKRENGSMTPQQVFGNDLATFLMRIMFKSRFTDLGPFRAIRKSTLDVLKMEDKTYGWTVEMQLKILKLGIKYVEIPVSYRNRIGVSKVSGTLKGTIMAGYKILMWIFKYGFKR